MNTPLVLVDDLFPDGVRDTIGGHGHFTCNEDGLYTKLTFVCHKCGHLGGIHFEPAGWTWNGSVEKSTCTPSILHECGWHRYLTDGIFVEC